MKSRKKFFVAALASAMMLSFNLSAVYASGVNNGHVTYFVETGGTGGVIFNNTGLERIGWNHDWTGNLNFSYNTGSRTLHGVWSHRALSDMSNGLSSRVRATTANAEARAWVQSGTCDFATTGTWESTGRTSEANVTWTFRGTNRSGWGIR